MGGTCSTSEEEERCIQGFGGERDHLEYPGLDGMAILRKIFRKLDVGHGLDRAGSG
jgi:hypothetical protein